MWNVNDHRCEGNAGTDNASDSMGSYSRNIRFSASISFKGFGFWILNEYFARSSSPSLIGQKKYTFHYLQYINYHSEDQDIFEKKLLYSKDTLQYQKIK